MLPGHMQDRRLMFMSDNYVEMAMNLLDFARTATQDEYLRFVEEIRCAAGDNAAKLAISALELTYIKVSI